jgi:hypothetical protein
MHLNKNKIYYNINPKENYNSELKNKTKKRRGNENDS